MIVRHLRVTGFILMHLRDNRPAFFVVSRQTIQVATQVRRHLVFGFLQKAEIPFIP